MDARRRRAAEGTANTRRRAEAAVPSLGWIRHRWREWGRGELGAGIGRRWSAARAEDATEEELAGRRSLVAGAAEALIGREREGAQWGGGIRRCAGVDQTSGWGACILWAKMPVVSQPLNDGWTADGACVPED